MNDHKTTLLELKKKVADFVQERDWGQFHSPKNLSMDIAIEAAELMEHFLWLESAESYAIMDKNRSNVEDECADILMALLCFSNITNIDLAQAFERKLEKTGEKYPVHAVKGRREKYTAYIQDKNNHNRKE